MLLTTNSLGTVGTCDECGHPVEFTLDAIWTTCPCCGAGLVLHQVLPLDLWIDYICGLSLVAEDAFTSL